ncbi:hypothetical protein VTI28DRAFT_2853 [Corynascus sepedonium]
MAGWHDLLRPLERPQSVECSEAIGDADAFTRSAQPAVTCSPNKGARLVPLRKKGKRKADKTRVMVNELGKCIFTYLPALTCQVRYSNEPYRLGSIFALEPFRRKKGVVGSGCREGERVRLMFVAVRNGNLRGFV